MNPKYPLFLFFLTLFVPADIFSQKQSDIQIYQHTAVELEIESSKSDLKMLQSQYEGTPIFATKRAFSSRAIPQNHVSGKSTQRTKEHRIEIPNQNKESLYISISGGRSHEQYTYGVVENGSYNAIENLVFNNEGEAVIGPYSSSNIKIIQGIYGDERLGIQEYIEVKEVYVDFTGNVSMDTGFGASFPCNDNIRCDNRSAIRALERSVVRVLLVLEEGLGFCSASLINNTSNDGTPYVLGGFHCQDGFTPRYDMWRFDFMFQSTTCQNPETEPAFRSMTGCHFVSGRQASDFLLLELDSEIPQDLPVYFNGWNVEDDYHPEPAVMIHHPAGDIKKISYESNSLRILNSGINWDNDIKTPAQHHFICEFDDGTHQPGSSGAPLFDMNGRMVGQLHGGVIDDGQCDQTRAYFGRLEKSWDEGEDASTRLRDWLDPLGTGVKTLDGADQEIKTVNYTVQVMTNNGDPLNGAELVLSGGLDEVLFSNENGNVSLIDIPTDVDFSITTSKDGNTLNGVSVTDMVQIRNHILGIATFEDEIQLLAADVNNNGSVSVTDIVQIQNVVLGLWEEFPNTESWKFIPPRIEVEGNKENTEINITSFKVGDVNFNADPSN